MRAKAIAAWALLLLAMAALCAPAQRPDLSEVHASAAPYHLPPLRITAQTNLVELQVVVRNQDGAPIAGLPQNDFQIYDNGALRPLSSFSAEATARSAAPAPAGTPVPAASLATDHSPQTASSSHSPRFLALLFDDVNTDQGDLNNARNAADRFVREALDPETRIAIFTVSATQSLDFTVDRNKLAAAIAAIRPHPRSSDRSMMPCPRILPFQAYLIAVLHDPTALAAARADAGACNGGDGKAEDSLRDELESPDYINDQVRGQAEATWEQAREISQDTLAATRGVIAYLARQPGRRILLLASGGFLSATLEGEQDAMIQAALRANVVINALDAKGLFTDGPGIPLDELPQEGHIPKLVFFFQEVYHFPQRQATEDAMVNLAQSTGGLFFHDDNDLTLGFDRLGLAPSVAYDLAFSPTDIAHDGKFHRLEVKLSPGIRSAVVQARRGYFAPAAAPANIADQRDAAMRAATTPTDVPATVAVRNGASGLQLEVRFDVHRIVFLAADGRRRQTLVVVAGLFDPKGRFVAGKRGELDLALKPDTFHRLSRQGLNADLSLAAPPGAYRLRTVVQEASDGKLSAFSQPVRIP